MVPFRTVLRKTIKDAILRQLNKPGDQVSSYKIKRGHCTILIWDHTKLTHTKSEKLNSIWITLKIQKLSIKTLNFLLS